MAPQDNQRAMIQVTVTLLVLSVSAIGTTNGNYVILGPTYFHPGWPVNMVVTLQEPTSEPIVVNAEFRAYYTISSWDVLDSTSITTGTGDSKILTLKVPATINPKFDRFVVDITSMGVIDHSYRIQKKDNQSVLLVQTDKNIYKPGQKVQFRVINLNKDLSPMNGPLTAIVVNAKGNKLERFDNLESKNGVVERDFQLSLYSSLGSWSIQLLNKKGELLFTNPFLVEEYVLPKFSVDVKPEPDFLVWGVYNQPPAIVVKTMYTYGKAVQGECILTIGQAGSNAKKANIVRKIPESGIVEFVDIDWNSLIGDKPSNKKLLIASVVVTDVMGRTEEGEATMDVFRDKYKVEILPESPSVLHSGLPSQFYIKVSDHFDQPVLGQTVKVRVSMPGMESLSALVKLEEGEMYISFGFTPIWSMADRNKDNFYEDMIKGSVKASLVSDPLENDDKSIFWFISNHGESVKIEVPQNMNVKKGEPQEFSVLSKSSRLEGSLTSYSVISQGVIVEAGVVRDGKVTITPTLAMCPIAKMVVYLLLPSRGGKNAEMVADSIQFAPSLCLDSKVKVTFDAKQQRTGTNANLQIDVVNQEDESPVLKAFEVFFLAVDKSIVLLQGDTDIDKKKVMGALDMLNNWSDQKPYITGNIFSSLGLEAMSDVRLQSLEKERPVVMNDVQRSGAVEAAIPSTNDKLTPVPEQKKAVPKIRKNFPDTWLWGHGKTTPSGQYRAQFPLPDTITSWYVSAFAVSDDSIAVTGSPFELTAFQPFFIALNLPYSIKKGEVFTLRVTVFNYRPQTVNAVVRLKASKDFTIRGGNVKDGWNEFTVSMAPNLAVSVEYEITASTIATIKFQVVADDLDDPAQRDEVIRKLIVKPPGEERDFAMTTVMLLIDQSSLTETFKIKWPAKDIVPGSQKLRFKVTGQVIGQSLSNLNRLVITPVGCGEQNMITMVPNIYGVTYIQQTGQIGVDQMVVDMVKNMKRGYQRQVDNYRMSDGSYSAFGESDKLGSTWLTAFVAKSFAAASRFIPVDKNVLDSAVSFIMSKQSSDGLFSEDGRVLHQELTVGTKKIISLTVYCLLSVLETTQSVSGTLDVTISKVLSQLPTIKASSKNGFLAAMTAYTLTLLDEAGYSESVQDEINDLLSFIEGKELPWETADSDSKRDVPPTERPSNYGPTNLMTGAYTLLAYLKTDNLPKSLKVMKWLQAQQNSRGGFGTTQDTVLILQSLAEFGIFFKSLETTGQIELSISGQEKKEVLDISGDRSILLQIVDLPITTDQIMVKLTGSSNTMAVVKIEYTYNTEVLSFIPEDRPVRRRRSAPAVDLTMKMESMTSDRHRIKACIKSSLDTGVGMYVLSMALPSGEVPYHSREEMLAKNTLAKRVEFDEDNIHFYLEDIPDEGYCLQATVERQMDFDVQLPGSTKFYSYYKPEYYVEKVLNLSQSIKCTESECGNPVSDGHTSVINPLLAICICIITSLLACV